MTEKERFDSIQSRAAKLIGDAEMLRFECHVPVQATELVRNAAYKGRQLVRLVSANAIDALCVLRKGEFPEVPTIADDDYDRFVNRVIGLAGAEGLSTSSVADAIMTVAETHLSQAEAVKEQVSELASVENR